MDDQGDLEQRFKRSMRGMPGPVTLITARDRNGIRHGMIASAACSVSVAPPSLLISINKHAGIHGALRDTGLFCVNILGCEHRRLVDDFSRTENRHLRFQSEAWQAGQDELPYLPDARSAIFCKVATTLSYASHTVFIGVVTEALVSEGASDALAWVNGGFAKLNELKVA